MKKQLITFIGLTVAASLSSPLAMAKNDQKKGHQNVNKDKPPHVAQKSSHKDSKPGHQKRFSSHELELMEDYFYRHRYDSGRAKLPKGLKKKYERTGDLPSGWQKKVQRGEVLPVDIYNSAGDIPFELRQQLPAGPAGSEVIKLESKIIRLMEGTRLILDVFEIEY